MPSITEVIVIIICTVRSARYVFIWPIINQATVQAIQKSFFWLGIAISSQASSVREQCPDNRLLDSLHHTDVIGVCVYVFFRYFSLLSSMFDPSSSAAAPAPAASASTGAPFDSLFGAAPAQPNTTTMPMQTQPQAQGFGMPMQQQAPYGQMSQPFMAQQQAGFMAQQQPAMSMNPFGAQPQQQPFMVHQQPQHTFGGMVPQQQALTSNPFAVGMQQPVQQQQAFVQQQPNPQMQNFMMMRQPQQQQQPFQTNFGAPAQPQQAKPAAKALTDDDMFFEEFVSMRMDGSTEA